LDFYVYIHKKKTNGEVFYVGKGRNKRAWSSSSRSRFWRAVVDKCGFDVQIIFSGLSEDDAFRHEIELISVYGRRDKGEGSLVNLSDGGEGCAGQIWSEERRKERSLAQMGSQSPSADPRLWTFYNHKMGITRVCTKVDFKLDFPDVSTGAIFHTGRHKGWIVWEVTPKEIVDRLVHGKPKKQRPVDTTVYHWVNINTEQTLTGTKSDLMRLSPKSIPRGVVTGRCLTTEGWTTLEVFNSLGKHALINHKVGEQNGNADKTEYLFKRLSDGFEYRGTRFKIESEFEISVGDIFQSRERIVAGGWCLASDFDVAISQSRVDYNVYYLTNTNGGFFKGTRLDFYHKYGFKIHALFRKTNTAKSVKGWYLSPQQPE